MDILNSTQINLDAQKLAATPAVKSAYSAKFLAPSQSSEQKATKAAHDFEAFFLYQMLELTDPGSVEGFDGGHGEEMFRQVRNEHIADEMTKAGGVGIADTIYNQLLKIQEENQ
tara:strand:- start:90493 stop:90834 length:342 start_codon:yes stop_codon:yes gene_type:complete